MPAFAMPRTRRMISLLFILALLAAMMSTILTRPPSTSASSWSPRWRDDFNFFNTSIWQALDGPVDFNSELQSYKADHAFTTNESGLSVLALKIDQGDYWGKGYTSGAVASKNGFWLSQGSRLEFRAKVPKGTAIWPALWLVNNPCPLVNACGSNWPPEIDVMELRGHEPWNIIQTHHWGTWPNNNYQASSFNTGVDMSQGYHTYAVEWFSNSITFYIDGVVRNGVRTTNITGGTMKVVMNVALSGVFFPPPYPQPDGSSWPYNNNTSPNCGAAGGPSPCNFMFVDYVQVDNFINSAAYPTIRWESANIGGAYIRHASSRGRIDFNPNPYADSEWKMVPGLADGNAVSFESVNFPGRFLRHRNAELWMDPYVGDDTFRRDATFWRRPGLANSAAVSFESYNFPGRYIRHRNWELFNESVSPGLGYSDATFWQR